MKRDPKDIHCKIHGFARGISWESLEKTIKFNRDPKEIP